MKFERLGNIIQIQKGKKPSFIDTPDENSVRVLQIDDLRNDNNLKFTNDKTGVFARENDVLIAWDGANAGTIGHGKSGFIGSTIALLRIGQPELYSTTFIGKFLQTQYNYLRNKSTGATIPHISRKALEDLKIPVIAISDQLHIANILSKAENLIAQRKESIALLDEFLKSTFLEMFGDPVRNEKGWEIYNLSELGSLDRGVSKARPRNSPELLGGIYPLIQTGNVTNSGVYITSYKQTYSELGLKQSKLWPKGTMLITIAANIAQTSILSFDACFPDSVVGFVTNTKKSRVLYVHFLFKFFQALLESKASQTAQKNINLDILRNLKVPCPPIALQTQFAQIVEKMEVLKTQYQQSLQELENLYGSLSQRAFKGELKLEEKEESLLMAAESAPQYQARHQSVIPKNKKGFAKQVLGGKIVSLFKDDPNFTHIKFQKLQYLAEHIAEEDLLWNYYRQAAGPHDNKFRFSVIAKLNENKWFEERNYRFYPLQKINDIDRFYQNYFSGQQDKLNELFQLLKNASEKLCEAIATIYAVWNNHIILNKQFDKANIKTDFFDWSSRKEEKFTDDEFEKALVWMQKHNIVPTGFGQLIKEKAGKK